MRCNRIFCKKGTATCVASGLIAMPLPTGPLPAVD
jgi:hypothetical protein